MPRAHFTEPNPPLSSTPNIDYTYLWHTVWEIENVAGLVFGRYAAVPLDDWTPEQKALRRILELAGRAMTVYPPQWPAKEDSGA